MMIVGLPKHDKKKILKSPCWTAVNRKEKKRNFPCWTAVYRKRKENNYHIRLLEIEKRKLPCWAT